MKLAQQFLLLLVVIVFVRADDAETQKREECLNKVYSQDPCNSSPGCKTEMDKLSLCKSGCLLISCSGSNCYAECLQSKCASYDQNTQNYLNEMIKCLTVKGFYLLFALASVFLYLLI